MFGKEVETNVQEGRLNSILGKGCKFKGTVDVEGTLRIDAEFEGVVNCPDTLVVGKTGVVKAEINVKNAVIGGKVIGNINATNKIELQSGSHIEGDIHTHRLVIDEGVFFEGSCKMGVTTEDTKAHSGGQVGSNVGQGGGQGGQGQKQQQQPNREKVGV
jgi:cytoskeletal protein CcmA (bactofilin family)